MIILNGHDVADLQSQYLLLRLAPIATRAEVVSFVDFRYETKNGLWGGLDDWWTLPFNKLYWRGELRKDIAKLVFTKQKLDIAKYLNSSREEVYNGKLIEKLGSPTILKIKCVEQW